MQSLDHSSYPYPKPLEPNCLFELSSKPGHIWIYFAESRQIEEVIEELRSENIAVLD